ncbi:MAG: ABC transporter ATP-binding protein [Lachnospiraceae bacterium]|nr:ABC transporter ATP-binding protein [Lachnospiraceae bacterium]MBR0153404.1 ABC transporter ATP-binding protein [Lachnospiraceae bacterium]
MVELKKICKDYPQGREVMRVLKDVDLNVEQGEYLAIMGPSGSGKTTLMNLLGFLDIPTSGEYLLEGVSHADSSDKELAKVRNEKIGFVFQNYYLLPKMNARENIALPLLYAGVNKKERLAKADEAMASVGLAGYEKSLPSQLSGGMCQRVAIARAMITKPALLLADEPTGALDTVSGSQIMDIFDELNANGTTIIMITHEPAIAKRAKKIMYIRDGVLTSERREEEGL